MKNRKYILALAVCLFVLLGCFGLVKNFLVEVTTATNPTPTPDQRYYVTTKDIPEELAYEILFTQVRELQSKDSESLAGGETTKFKESFYENRLGLEASKFSSLTNIVNDYFAEIQPVDQRAKELIDQYRSLNPTGQLGTPQPTPIPQSSQLPQGIVPSRKSYKPLPAPPAELGQLQNTKKQKVLEYKNRIEQTLGSTNFSDFNSAVYKNAMRVLIPLNFKGTLPTPTPTPNN